jgi:hypothetical protein
VVAVLAGSGGAALAALAALATPVGPLAAIAALARLAPVSPLPALASIAGPPIAVAIAAATATSVAGAARDEGRRDQRSFGAARVKLDPLGLAARRSGWQHRDHAQGVEVTLDLGPQDVTGPSVAGQDGTVDRALGLAGAGGAPRP